MQSKTDPLPELLQLIRKGESIQWPKRPRATFALLFAVTVAFEILIGVLAPIFGLLLMTAKSLGSQGLIPELGPIINNVLWIVGATTVVAWARSLYLRANQVEQHDQRIDFDREQNPRLWYLLDTIARNLDAPIAHRVEAVPFRGYAVYEEKTGWRKPRRLVVRLGFHNVERLSPEEFASLLIHCYARFGAGHTRTVLRLEDRIKRLRNMRKLLREDGNLCDLNPIYQLLQLYNGIFGRLFRRGWHQVIYGCDDVAAMLLGEQSTRRALIKLDAGDARIDAFLERGIEGAIEANNAAYDVLGALDESADRNPGQDWINAQMRSDRLRDDVTETAIPHTADRMRNLDAGGTGGTQGLDELHESGQLERNAIEDSAWFQLLGDDATDGHRSTHQTMSHLLLTSRVDVSRRAFGVRGGPALPPGLEWRQPITMGEHPAYVKWSLYGSALLALPLAAFAIESLFTSPDQRGVFVVLTASMVLFSLLAVRFARARVQLLTEAIESRGLLASRRSTWDQVQSIRTKAKKVVVQTDRRSFQVKGDEDTLALFQDIVLERSPRLALVAWGTGLTRVSAPFAEGASPTPDLRPRSVSEKQGELIVEGPGDGRIVFGKQHRHLREIREAIEFRLLQFAGK